MTNCAVLKCKNEITIQQIICTHVFQLHNISLDAVQLLYERAHHLSRFLHTCSSFHIGSGWGSCDNLDDGQIATVAFLFRKVFNQEAR